MRSKEKSTSLQAPMDSREPAAERSDASQSAAQIPWGPFQNRINASARIQDQSAKIAQLFGAIHAQPPVVQGVFSHGNSIFSEDDGEYVALWLQENNFDYVDFLSKLVDGKTNHGRVTKYLEKLKVKKSVAQIVREARLIEDEEIKAQQSKEVAGDASLSSFASSSSSSSASSFSLPSNSLTVDDLESSSIRTNSSVGSSNSKVTTPSQNSSGSNVNLSQYSLAGSQISSIGQADDANDFDSSAHSLDSSSMDPVDEDGSSALSLQDLSFNSSTNSPLANIDDGSVTSSSALASGPTAQAGDTSTLAPNNSSVPGDLSIISGQSSSDQSMVNGSFAEYEYKSGDGGSSRSASFIGEDDVYRPTTKKTESAKVYTGLKAMQAARKLIREMRKGKQLTVRTLMVQTGDAVHEMTASPWRKDVGAYSLAPAVGKKGKSRKGNAEPYAALAASIDSILAKKQVTTAGGNYVLKALLKNSDVSVETIKQVIPKFDDECMAVMRKLFVILLVDLARSQNSLRLILDEVLNEATSFRARFGAVGSKKPTYGGAMNKKLHGVGGVQYLRNN